MENLIKSKGFSKNVLVAHSMGGLVVSHYLAKGSFQRGTVSKFIAVAPPFWGVPKMVEVSQTGNALDDRWLNFLLKMSTAMPYTVRNLPSTYELMPNQYYFTKAKSKYLKYGSLKTDYASSTNVLIGLPNFNKTLMTKAESIHAKLFPSAASGNHIVSLIKDKYYCIMGKGIETAKTLEVDQSTGTLWISEFTTDGDGVVPIWSSNMGYGKIYYGKIKHVDLAANSQSIKQVINIINGKPNDKVDGITKG